MKKLFIVAVIAAFSVAGVPPSATVVSWTSSAYAAQTKGKIKKKHGYTAGKTAKKTSKSKMKKATP